MSEWWERAGSYINPLNLGESWEKTINNPLTRDLLKDAGLQNLGKNSNPLNPENYLFGGLGTIKDVYGNVSGNTDAKKAAEEAAKKQNTALDNATASQERMFNAALDTQRPWLEAGGRGLGQLEAGINSGAFETAPGQYNGPPAFKDLTFDFEADPGYQFRLSEGSRAVEASAAARGGLFSGKTGTDLQGFAQGLASQEYGAAYNRFADKRDYNRQNYQDDRNFSYGAFNDDFNRRRATNTDKYNRLASLAGVGQVTANNVAGMQNEQGGNLGNLALQRGNVAAQLLQSNAQLDQQNKQGAMQIGAAALAAFSDRTVKENIDYLGLENGHKVYGFNYIGDPVRYKGVMAQEVQETNPGAVILINGIMAVDYGKIGVKFEVMECH